MVVLLNFPLDLKGRYIVIVQIFVLL